MTMRDLQKMSAGSIAALPHAVPVKSGATTVAVLVPIQKAPPDLVARVMAQIDAAASAPLVEVAGERLRCATAFRNGSTRDAHLLALAWITDSDLWTHDRDFAGTGWPTWSSHNLMTVLVATSSN